MSWMYSDEDYWREQKEQHKSIMKHLKRMAQLEKEMLKHLWVPVYDKQGKAFIEPKKHAAWKRAVKWNARPINTNGQYIKDALEVMAAVEANGYEAGFKVLDYVDVNAFGILDLVDKFYHHGHEFSDKYVRSHPDWLEKYPKLNKYLDGKDPEVSKEELQRSTEALKEAITFTETTRDSLNLSDVDISRANISIKCLKDALDGRQASRDTSRR